MPLTYTKKKTSSKKDVTAQFFAMNFSSPDCIGTGVDPATVAAVAAADASFVDANESKGGGQPFSKSLLGASSSNNNNNSVEGAAQPLPAAQAAPATAPLSSSPNPAPATTQAGDTAAAADGGGGAGKDDDHGGYSDEARPSHEVHNGKAGAAKAAAGATLDSMTYEELMTDPNLTNAAFAGVDDLRRNHNCSSGAANEVTSIEDVRRGTMGRIFRELRDMAGLSGGGLVLTKDTSMFLRCDELKPQYMRALITGVSGTPYAYGCFVFDIFAPSDYPTCCPQCIHVTPGADAVYGTHTPGGMSPNLHRDSGKVCLSLLGTWDGPGWDPQRSTLYQLLTTIAFQILAAEEPYYMEPGHGGWEGTAPKQGSPCAITYKEEVQRGTLLCGMIFPLSQFVGPTRASRTGMKSSPFRSFRGVVLRHFYAHRRDIVASVLQWLAATTCDHHRHALRALGLRVLRLLALVVAALRGKAAAGEYLDEQLRAVVGPFQLTSKAVAAAATVAAGATAQATGNGSGGGGSGGGGSKATSSSTDASAAVAGEVAAKPLPETVPTAPMGNGISWQDGPTAEVLFAELNEAAAEHRRGVERERRRKARLLRQRAAAKKVQRQAQLEEAAKAKREVARRAAARRALARVRTHLDAAAADPQTLELLSGGATAVADLRWFADQNPDQVARLERATAAVLHCGPRYNEAVRQLDRSVAALADRARGQTRNDSGDGDKSSTAAAAAAAGGGGTEWVGDLATAAALAETAATSDAVVASTVMVWAAGHLDGAGGGPARACGLQGFAARVHRVALLHAMASQLASDQPDRPRRTSELGAQATAWLKPPAAASARPTSRPTAVAAAVAAKGARGAALDGFDVFAEGFPACERVAICDVQELGGDRGRSLEVVASLPMAVPAWVAEARVTTVEAPLLAAALRVLGDGRGGVPQAALRCLDDRVGFLLQSVGVVSSATATTSGRPDTGTQQGHDDVSCRSGRSVLVRNPRAASRGGPKGSPEYVVVVAAAGTARHTTTSSAAADALAAVGAEFPGAVRGVGTASGPGSGTGTSDEAASSSEESGGGAAAGDPEWVRRKAARLDARRLERMQRRQSRKSRSNYRRNRKRGGFHAVELSMSYDELDAAPTADHTSPQQQPQLQQCDAAVAS